MEKNFCPYGFKCQFAHGIDELRVNLDFNKSYKTKTCHSFIKNGFCCYGERCNFLHQAKVLSEKQHEIKWKKIYANYREIIKI
jgi:hypothetical protein